MTVGSIASVKRALNESSYKGLFCIRIKKSYEIPAKITHAWIRKEHLRNVLICSGLLDMNDLIGHSILFDEESRHIRIPFDNKCAVEIECEDMSS